MGRSETVRVEHDGIKLDRSDLGAVLFFLDSADAEESEDGDGDVTWIPRSLLKSFDDDEMWIPQWKADELGVDYE